MVAAEQDILALQQCKHFMLLTYWLRQKWFVHDHDAYACCLMLQRGRSCGVLWRGAGHMLRGPGQAQAQRVPVSDSAHPGVGNTSGGGL